MTFVVLLEENPLALLVAHRVLLFVTNFPLTATALTTRYGVLYVVNDQMDATFASIDSISESRASSCFLVVFGFVFLDQIFLKLRAAKRHS